MEQSQDRITEAEGALDHARDDLEKGGYNRFCFSSQHVVGKGMMAVLQKPGAHGWGHSVIDLVEELCRPYEAPEKLIEKVLELDKAYMHTHTIPDALPSGFPWEKTAFSGCHQKVFMR
ncbi:HEPN domain protein [Spirochaeta thermophila DSM 6578]|uniref:HEPN domain protein n=1 Tax=Winmispira thermophila (strain ATCC 700085 / DSM 6578 / Z-1203) TaxID=869211 RepID=G0GB77_WINT7|nr:HEPN domain-containing protein [Spirochaeta thermophila]AEJ61886.1 HEPN domain protein [Spirochaeta thermophila DSM 6578]